MSRCPSSRNGFSLIEVMVGLVLSFIVMGGAYSLLNSSRQASIRAERRARQNTAQAEFSQITNLISQSMAPTAFDPRTTLLMTAATGAVTQAVGLSWPGSAPNATPSTKVLWTAVSPVSTIKDPVPFPRPRSSYDLDLSRITDNGAGQATTNKLESMMLSRCVDPLKGRVQGVYKTLADIDALPRPTITAANTVMCCPWTGTPLLPPTNTSTCLPVSARWPTVFSYRGDGNVSVYPADSDRDVLPGLGFVLFVDSAVPTTYYMATIAVLNTCLSSAAKGVANCTQTKLGEASYANFVRDVKTRITMSTGQPSRDLTGSSFINLGTKSIQGP